MSKIHVINSGTYVHRFCRKYVKFFRELKILLLMKKKDLNNVDKIILPGVGSFDHNVKNYIT